MPTNTHDYSWPVEIVYGIGAADELPDLVKTRVADVVRAFVVADRALLDAGIADRLLDGLGRAGIQASVFAAEGEPTESLLADGLARFGDSSHDLLIAIGGGSSIDLAKAINVAAHNEGELRSFEGFERVPNAGLPLVTIPTTAGTGSEVGSGLVVTAASGGGKFLVDDKKYWPTLCVLDPQLTVSLPRAATVYTGLDALAQAIGAYVVNITQPLLEPLALRAIKLIDVNLSRVAEHPDDLNARLAMQWGSALAGGAMCNAECSADHSFGEVIGPRYAIPHGLSVAIFLPRVSELNAETGPQRYAEIARDVLGVEEASDAVAAKALVERLYELTQELAVPSLGELGVPREDLPELVAATLEHGNMDFNPRRLTEPEVVGAYESAFV